MSQQNEGGDGQDHQKLDQKYKDIMLNLPKERGWAREHFLQYQGFWIYPRLLEGVLRIKGEFKPKPSDIILATYPKCGSSWMKALLFAIINRDVHSDFSKSHPLLTNNAREFVPFLDDLMCDNDFVSHRLDDLPSPRLLCTHSPYTLLPDSIKASGCKFVNIYRDPKDVFVSSWYFALKLKTKELPPLSMEDAFELFCKGVSGYGPFWDHVLGYWKPSLESPEKVLFLVYEDMKRDPLVQVKRLAEFLGKPFSLQEEKDGVLHEIVNLCSFESLSNLEVNKSTESRYIAKNPYYFRKGQVGDWQNHLTPEMAARIDQITKEKLPGFGLGSA